MLTSPAISWMAPQMSSTPCQREIFEQDGVQHRHADQALTRLNDAREALRQGTPSRAVLQVCVLEGVRKRMGWHGGHAHRRPEMVTNSFLRHQIALRINRKKGEMG